MSVLDAERLADGVIARQLPATWSAFFARFGRLTPIQRLAIRPILDGSDVVITAPTASGKTEAVCAPLVERWHRSERWRILYVSPTRALVNDLFGRLHAPIAQLGCHVARRTGDHNQRPPEGTNLLLTTPESFDSLLCRARTLNVHFLQPVCAVVLDEVHLLHGSARGEQLRWLLARLRRVREAAGLSAPQVIALSATVDDPEGIRMAYAPSGVFLQAGGGRTIERVSVPGIGGAIEDQLPTYVERLEHPEKVLVFSNSRKRVDTLALRLRRDLEPFGYVVCAHHGSLARKIREDAEASARKERKFVLVSSSTLEVGVDIGDIDLVALDGPPPDIMSLLQRIGRGNRRTGCTRVMACARSMTEALVQTSMLKAAEEGYLGRRESGPQLAVARQQIASFIFQRLTGQRTVTQLRAFCSHVRSELNAEELIDHMTSARELLPTSSALRLGDFWQEQAASGAIHSNIESNTGQSVSDDFTGEEIATGVRFKEGPGMRIGGRMLQVRDWDEFRVSVRQVSKTDLADARWNYVVGPRLKGAGQADAVSGFLRIATGHWPVVRASGRYVVFHFGGGRRRAVLELIQKLHPGLAFTRADEWAIYFERRPEKPEWSDSVDVARVARLASSSVTALERTLARPRANSKLPASFREREIHDWLNIDGEVVAFRSSCWADPPDSDVAEALESLAKDLLR